MTNLIIQVSKYLIIILMALYTLQCYTVFGKKDEDAREYLFLRQNMLMFAMHFVAFTVLYLQQTELTLLLFTVRRRFIWRQCLSCSGICIRWLPVC